MRHSINFKGSTIDIDVFVSVINKETNELVDKRFDTWFDAHKYYPRSHFRFVWTAVPINYQPSLFQPFTIPVYGGRFKDIAIIKLTNFMSYL